jgi:hypothetical protein
MTPEREAYLREWLSLYDRNGGVAVEPIDGQRDIRELLEEIDGLRLTLEEAYSDAYPDRSEQDMLDHVEDNKNKIKNERTKDNRSVSGGSEGVGTGEGSR